MNIIKKIFCISDDSAIGLCKFNEEQIDINEAKERFKKQIKKDTNLTQMLKRSI